MNCTDTGTPCVALLLPDLRAAAPNASRAIWRTANGQRGYAVAIVQRITYFMELLKDLWKNGLHDCDTKDSILLPDLRGGCAARLHAYLAHDWVERGYRVEIPLMQKRGELLSLLSPESPWLNSVLNYCMAVVGPAWAPVPRRRIINIDKMAML